MLIYVAFALKRKKGINGYVAICATYGITDFVWTWMMRNGQQYLQHHPSTHVLCVFEEQGKGMKIS